MVMLPRLDLARYPDSEEHRGRQLEELGQPADMRFAQLPLSVQDVRRNTARTEHGHQVRPLHSALLHEVEHNFVRSQIGQDDLGVILAD